MTTPVNGYVDERRRELFMLAKNAGMSRDERIDLAEFLLRRDISSWRTLTDEQVGRLLDAFEGHALISYLISQRHP